MQIFHGHVSGCVPKTDLFLSKKWDGNFQILTGLNLQSVKLRRKFPLQHQVSYFYSHIIRFTKHLVFTKHLTVEEELKRTML